MSNFTQLSLFDINRGACTITNNSITEKLDTDRINNFIKINDLNSSFHEYVNYLLLRDEVSRLRIRGLTHSHEYFKTYPSCQNRRYMDRESQYFIMARNRYEGENPLSDAVFHLIFRKFSTYDAVKYRFKEYPGNLMRSNKDIKRVIKFLQLVDTPFTGAYLIPHRNKSFNTKIEGWLHVFKEFDFEGMAKISSAKECYETFRRLGGFGDFLAMQFATELSWLNCTKFKFNEFVVPGNGAVRGLSKIGVSKKNQSQFLHKLVNFNLLSDSVWLPMTLMDYQNTFCEFDKFTRFLGGYDNFGRVRMKRTRKSAPIPIKEFATTEKLKDLNNY